MKNQESEENEYLKLKRGMKKEHFETALKGNKMKTDMRTMTIKNRIYTRRDNGTLRIQTVNDKPSRTQQQFKDECDVNNIIKKYKTTGIITHTNNKTGVYADMTEIGNYQEALGKVIEAETAFNNLPSAIRSKFHNNPQELIEYLNDKDKFEESIKLGLRVKKAEPETTLKDLDKTMKLTLEETKKRNKVRREEVYRDHTEE